MNENGNADRIKASVGRINDLLAKLKSPAEDTQDSNVTSLDNKRVAKQDMGLANQHKFSRENHNKAVLQGVKDYDTRVAKKQPEPVKPIQTENTKVINAADRFRKSLAISDLKILMNLVLDTELKKSINTNSIKNCNLLLKSGKANNANAKLAIDEVMSLLKKNNTQLVKSYKNSEARQYQKNFSDWYSNSHEGVGEFNSQVKKKMSDPDFEANEFLGYHYLQGRSDHMNNKIDHFVNNVHKEFEGDEDSKSRLKDLLVETVMKHSRDLKNDWQSGSPQRHMESKVTDNLMEEQRRMMGGKPMVQPGATPNNQASRLFQRDNEPTGIDVSGASQQLQSRISQKRNNAQILENNELSQNKTTEVINAADRFRVKKSFKRKDVEDLIMLMTDSLISTGRLSLKKSSSKPSLDFTLTLLKKGVAEEGDAAKIADEVLEYYNSFE